MNEVDLEPVVVARAHHGSLSQEERRATEEQLKAGDLPSVVATASLETRNRHGSRRPGLPGGFARRRGSGAPTGRSGRAYRRADQQGSPDRPDDSSDLLEAAALTQGHDRRRRRDACRYRPTASTSWPSRWSPASAVEPWDVQRQLFDFIRSGLPVSRPLGGGVRLESSETRLGSLPDGQLPRPPTAESVGIESGTSLTPLPGSARMAIMGGGTIPDTGQYPLYLGEGGPQDRRTRRGVCPRTARRRNVHARHGHLEDRRDRSAEGRRFPRRGAIGRDGALLARARSRAEDGRTRRERVGSLCRDLAAIGSTTRGCSAGSGTECRLAPPAAKTVARSCRPPDRRVAGRRARRPDDRRRDVHATPTGEVGLAVLCPLRRQDQHGASSSHFRAGDSASASA